MAIFTPGPAIAEIRGSQGGTVFSRNRHGQYTRQRSVPINPQSTAQMAARARLSALTVYWRDTLTPAERLVWETYANATNWINGVGEVTHLTGLNMFLRSAAIALQVGAHAYIVGPSIPGIPSQETNWTPTAAIATQLISIAFTFNPNVQDKDYAYYAGPPVNSSHLFFAGPWRYIGAIIGNPAVPPASPQTFAYPWTLGAGQKVFVYCRRLDPDNRLTEPFPQSCVPA